MTWPIRFDPAAQRELNEAADFYDADDPGLGGAFLDAIERAIKQIQALPESSPIALAPVRTKVLSALPFSVIYWVTDGVLRLCRIVRLPPRVPPASSLHAHRFVFTCGLLSSPKVITQTKVRSRLSSVPPKATTRPRRRSRSPDGEDPGGPSGNRRARVRARHLSQRDMPGPWWTSPSRSTRISARTSSSSSR
jgi:hypothetical protein